MANEQHIPIELKGIVRNQTKLGVEDGCSEDLMNLRFKDGSWRTAGEGKRITSFDDMLLGYSYSQIFVHVNSTYKHLLGVCEEDGKSILYWFGNINSTNDEVFEAVPRVAITEVSGDLYITQTGHVITIIDEKDDFENFVFKTSTNKYKKVVVDVNGKQSYRSLYPFGSVHFNLYEPKEEITDTTDIFSESYAGGDFKYLFRKMTEIELKETSTDYYFDNDIPIDDAKTLFRKAAEKNKFTHPFLACAAIRLYDGSFVFASNPVLLYPRQTTTSGKKYYVPTTIGDENVLVENAFTESSNNRIHYGFYDVGFYGGDGKKIYPFAVELNGVQATKHKRSGNINDADSWNNITDNLPVLMTAAQLAEENHPFYKTDDTWYWQSIVLGSDLCCSIDDISKLVENSDVFQSLCIFISQPINPYKLDKDSVKMPHVSKSTNNQSGLVDLPMFPQRYSDEDLIKSLINSPFFLLKEYRIEEVANILNNPIVDLTSIEDEGRLKNIVQQERLSIESTSRATYLPKVQYNYNGRLHIANYKTNQFHGYPLDLFQLNNMSLKYEEGKYFPNDTDKKILPNLTDNNNNYLHWSRLYHPFFVDSTFGPGSSVGAERIKAKEDVFAFVEVEIETDNGTQKVSRVIEPYGTVTPAVGRMDFVQSLDPLLTFPDYRAKKMTVYFLSIITENGGDVELYHQTFNLKPHPYLNMAYYIANDLKPINVRQSSLRAKGSGTFASLVYRYINGVAGTDYEVDENITEFIPRHAPIETNTQEYFPNGLKVSKAQNPMFFPVEYTYQVGSAEILALMSNTIAVGTGQTGAAPLYVFCKDGVYGLFVDATGEMAYTNARILARDVLSVRKSVTPIDAGVVFVTKRGLMMIAGEQVQEIGQPAEGDVFNFQTFGTDKAKKLMYGAFTEDVLAALPDAAAMPYDFLSYLNNTTNNKQTIINYNHNERELIVSNPNLSYSWVWDRFQNWSRRLFTADEYINNFPTSYRLRDGEIFKCDVEADGRDEADNGMFVLSAPLKLGSTGFKQGSRFIVRGLFETPYTYRKEDVAVPESHTYLDLYDEEHSSTRGPLVLNIPAEHDGMDWELHNVKLMDDVEFTVNRYQQVTQLHGPGKYDYPTFEDGMIYIRLGSTDYEFDTTKTNKIIVAMTLKNKNTNEVILRKEFNGEIVSDEPEAFHLVISAYDIALPTGTTLRRGKYMVSWELVDLELHQKYKWDETETVTNDIGTMNPLYNSNAISGSGEAGQSAVLLQSNSADIQLGTLTFTAPLDAHSGEITSQLAKFVLSGVLRFAAQSGCVFEGENADLLNNSITIEVKLSDGTNNLLVTIPLVLDGKSTAVGDDYSWLEHDMTEETAVETALSTYFDAHQLTPNTQYQATVKIVAYEMYMKYTGIVQTRSDVASSRDNNVDIFSISGAQHASLMRFHVQRDRWDIGTSTITGSSSFTYQSFEPKSASCLATIKAKPVEYKFGVCCHSSADQWGEFRQQLLSCTLKNDSKVIIGIYQNVNDSTQLVKTLAECKFNDSDNYFELCTHDSSIDTKSTSSDVSITMTNVSTGTGRRMSDDEIIHILQPDPNDSTKDVYFFGFTLKCYFKSLDSEIFQIASSISGTYYLGVVPDINLDINKDTNVGTQDYFLFGSGLVKETAYTDVSNPYLVNVNYASVWNTPTAAVKVVDVRPYDLGAEPYANLKVVSDVIRTPEYAFETRERQIDTAYLPVDVHTLAHTEKRRVISDDGLLGLYIFGSYDGRQWAFLGGNERKGSFTDIGCKIERKDVKFLRYALAGQLKGNSRIDFAELSAKGSVLNNKIR